MQQNLRWHTSYWPEQYPISTPSSEIMILFTPSIPMFLRATQPTTLSPDACHHSSILYFPSSPNGCCVTPETLNHHSKKESSHFSRYFYVHLCQDSVSQFHKLHAAISSLLFHYLIYAHSVSQEPVQASIMHIHRHIISSPTPRLRYVPEERVSGYV